MSRAVLHCVDAFTDKAFSGNPAVVCFSDGEMAVAFMQQVACEINLSETAFIRKIGESRYTIRWFTPTMEVDLCGHATLASAHVLFETGAEQKAVTFISAHHELKAVLSGDSITLDFPLVTTSSCESVKNLCEGLGIDDVKIYMAGDDYLIELDDENAVLSLSPDFNVLGTVATRGVIVTARSAGKYDFVSRFFAPSAGIDEDPVTGSAHCALAHYWSEKLDKGDLKARQVSKRGGDIDVAIKDERVTLTGKAVTVWQGILR